jgi:hypothetical protein
MKKSLLYILLITSLFSTNSNAINVYHLTSATLHAIPLEFIGSLYKRFFAIQAPPLSITSETGFNKKREKITRHHIKAYIAPKWYTTLKQIGISSALAALTSVATIPATNYVESEYPWPSPGWKRDTKYLHDFVDQARIIAITATYLTTRHILKRKNRRSIIIDVAKDGSQSFPGLPKGKEAKFLTHFLNAATNSLKKLNTTSVKIMQQQEYGDRLTALHIAQLSKINNNDDNWIKFQKEFDKGPAWFKESSKKLKLLK